MGLSSISDVVFNADTDREKKSSEMTQLIENNVWLMKGYENFQLKNCAVKAMLFGKN